jgi:hypothetical protein
MTTLWKRLIAWLNKPSEPLEGDELQSWIDRQW